MQGRHASSAPMTQIFAPAIPIPHQYRKAMPSGKLSCLVSGNARLLEDVSLPATVVIDVLGSAYHASSHINGRATSQDGETQVAADTSRDLEPMYLH